MWSTLPFDLLSFIFSFLPPDSLARARSTCRNWHTCTIVHPFTSTTHSHPPWFLSFPIRYHKPCCYTLNPITQIWHELSLDFLPIPRTPIRPVSSIGSLILLKFTNSNSTSIQLGLCNPFTKQFKHLPRLNISRTNPAAGVIILDHGSQFPRFRVYVAGGMSEAARGGGATYEPTVEMYDSELDAWRIVGSVPVEFAVRLTVWTPNENVCVKGTLYWITSARAYSLMGFDFGVNTWRGMGVVPMAEKLEFATLVKRNGALALVGGTCGGGVLVWEMNDEGGDIKWCVVDEVPVDLGLRLLSGKRNWESVKCVGNGDGICLYKDLGSGMVVSVCKKIGGVCNWEWVWLDGCGYIKGKQVPNFPMRGALLHPTLASFLE